MKYFNITLRKNQGSTTIVYPKNYQSEIGDFNAGHIYYDVDDTAMLLMCIKDKDANNIVRTDVEEITETEAKAISVKNEVSEAITDEAKVRRLEIKAARGKSFTADEEKALDPNDETSGFSMARTLARRIDELKVIENKYVK